MQICRPSVKSCQRIKAALMVRGSQTSAKASSGCDSAGSCLCTAGPALGPDCALEEGWQGELLWDTHCSHTPLDPAGMEGPASTLCLRTCYIKDCKPLSITENPPGLGPAPLPRSCSCSRRIVKPEWPNSASKCALPIIPEYPGFQDVKVCMPKLSLQ